MEQPTRSPYYDKTYFRQSKDLQVRESTAYRIDSLIVQVWSGWYSEDEYLNIVRDRNIQMFDYLPRQQ